MRLRDLVQDPAAWLDSHETSPEIGEAIAARLTAYDPAEFERLWAEPTEEEREAVVLAAWDRVSAALTAKSEAARERGESPSVPPPVDPLHWGEETYVGGKVPWARSEGTSRG